MNGTTHTTFLPDGGTKVTFSEAPTYTGGTGKFKGIWGTEKYTGIWDPVKGLNEVTSEFDYWIG